MLNATPKLWRGMCKLCTFLFWPQMGRKRRKRKLLKKEITYLIGKERAEGNIDSISPIYISRVLNMPLEEVESCMKEMGI